MDWVPPSRNMSHDDDLKTVDGDDHTPAATELHCHTMSEARESHEVNEPLDDAEEIIEANQQEDPDHCCHQWADGDPRRGGL